MKRDNLKRANAIQDELSYIENRLACLNTIKNVQYRIIAHDQYGGDDIHNYPADKALHGAIITMVRESLQQWHAALDAELAEL